MPTIRSMDVDTGEVLEGAVVGVFFPKQQNGFLGGWLAMSQDALLKLAQMDLGDEARRVLFAVLSKLDFENYILISQADIGDLLNIKRANVSRAISKLEDYEILQRGPKVGRASTFRLNPTFGWKGSAANHRKALKERMAAAGIKGVVAGNEDV